MNCWCVSVCPRVLCDCVTVGVSVSLSRGCESQCVSVDVFLSVLSVFACVFESVCEHV